jgi:hypothetical protein
MNNFFTSFAIQKFVLSSKVLTSLALPHHWHLRGKWRSSTYDRDHKLFSFLLRKARVNCSIFKKTETGLILVSLNTSIESLVFPFLR